MAADGTDRYWLHLLLFGATLITTLMAGAEFLTAGAWLGGLVPGARQLGLADLGQGLPFALAFLAFLSTHEFGHYFAARWHGVRCSLPYYIPVFIPIPGILNIGSFGAVIRIRERPRSTRQYFDIGIAGPLAGAVISIGLLLQGFLSLPPPEYVLSMNPDYLPEFGGVPSRAELLARYGAVPELGNSLLFWLMESTLPDPARMPNHLELFHYPFLFVGYLTLFFTALNLLPIGQLDGGHVSFGLFGARRAALLSRVFILGLIAYGGLGILDFSSPYWPIPVALYALYLFWVLPPLVQRDYPLAIALGGGIVGLQLLLQTLLPGPQTPYVLWLLYALLATRVIRPDHPPVAQQQPLSRKRRLLGCLALVLFVLCFSPRPVRIARAAEAPAKPPPAPTEQPTQTVQAAHTASFPPSR